MIIVASNGRNFFFTPLRLMDFEGQVSIIVRDVIIIIWGTEGEQRTSSSLFLQYKKTDYQHLDKGRYEVSLCLYYLSAASGYLIYTRDLARPSELISAKREPRKPRGIRGAFCSRENGNHNYMITILFTHLWCEGSYLEVVGTPVSVCIYFLYLLLLYLFLVGAPTVSAQFTEVNQG